MTPDADEGQPPPDLFALLVASVADYAIFALGPDGRVASWNLGAERLKGYRAEEIVGRHFSTFYTPEDAADGLPARLLEAAARDGRVESEGIRVRKDGSRFWADVVITALRDPAGRLQGFAKVTRDVTARKEAEDNLRESEERSRRAADELRQLDRMKNEFVAMVAHDLSSPLSVVAGFVDLLLERWDQTPDADKRDILGRVSRTASDLTALVTDILAVARIEAGQLDVLAEPFDLAALVRRAAVETSPPQTPDRIAVALPDAPTVAVGDERRTWQVLTNLLSNAVKFSPADTAVEVQVQGDDRTLTVSVHDQGPGVPAGEQGRVFERFVRGTPPGRQPPRGSGLGLYISKNLVEAQGGTIWVEGEPGGGATFRFTLARASSDG